MADVTVAGASYQDVPAVQLPQTGGGSCMFYEATEGDNLEYGITDGTLPLVGVAKAGYAEI